MDVHHNARTIPRSRMLIVQRLADGWRPSVVALVLSVTVRTVCKWRDRFAAEARRGWPTARRGCTVVRPG